MQLSFSPSHVTCDGRVRPITERERLLQLTASYRELVARRAPPDQLLPLGRELHRWLDGPGAWLDGFGRRRTTLEVIAAEAALLDVPWELLADDLGFIAARVALDVHRRAERADTRRPAPARLPRLLFMAAAPRGVSPLRYEDEEAAILHAVRADGPPSVDLFGEDTGALQPLLSRLALLRPVDVLHISGHGTAAQELVLEDDEGGAQPVPARQFARALSPELPHLGLIFLSMCELGAPMADAAARLLLEEGAPAVLAWAGAVRDDEATRFAATLYAMLGRGHAVGEAVAEARRALQKDPSRCWHLARLYLGPDGGGPLGVPGGVSTARVRHRDVRWLDARRQAFPVATELDFVGRREQLQVALRQLRQGRGVLLHGIGQQGKSSLALRLADRLQPDLKALVVHGVLQPALVHQRLALDLGERPTEPVGDMLEADLVRWLEAGAFLLVVDDLEQNLDEGQEPVRVKAEGRPALRAILRAFDRATTRCRLVVTSRYRFVLPDADGRDLAATLHPLAVPAMSLQERGRLRAPGALADHLRRRIEEVGRGHAGLTDRLLRLAVSAPEAAEEAIEAMERSGPPPAGTELATVYAHIALDKLFEVAGRHPGALDLLAAALVFLAPVPRDVVQAVAQTFGWDARERLEALGLLEAARDPVVPALTTLVVTPWAAGRVTQLDEAGADAVLAAAHPALRAAWAGRAEGTAALQLFCTALAAGDAATVQGTVFTAATELESAGRAGASLVERGVGLLDGSDLTPPPWALLKGAEMVFQAGDVALAAAWLQRARGALTEPRDVASLLLREARVDVQAGRVEAALAALEQAQQLFSQVGDTSSRAVTLRDIARIRVSRGQVDEALRLHEERLRVFEQLGDARERAVTLGDIARIRVSRGQVDEALRLHEERLRVFEQLGDARSRAVTLGGIARIRVSRGQVDEALRLHEERLRVFEQLGDARERAVTLGDIARIRVDRGQVDEAKALQEERLQVNEALGDLDGIAAAHHDLAHIAMAQRDVQAMLQHAVVAWQTWGQTGRVDGVLAAGSLLGQLLLATGDRASAEPVLLQAAAAADQLGRTDHAAQLRGLLS